MRWGDERQDGARWGEMGRDGMGREGMGRDGVWERWGGTRWHRARRDGARWGGGRVGLGEKVRDRLLVRDRVGMRKWGEPRWREGGVGQVGMVLGVGGEGWGCGGGLGLVCDGWGEVGCGGLGRDGGRGEERESWGGRGGMA